MSTLILRVTQPILRRAVQKASKQLLKYSTIGIATYYLIVNDAHCMSGKKDGDENNNGVVSNGGSGNGGSDNGGNDNMGRGKPDEIENAIAKFSPYINQLGFGTITGFCSGYALKKVGQMAAILIGVAFVGFQAVKYYTGSDKLVDLDRFKKEAEKRLDQDGDGKFDASDLIIIWRKFKDIMTNNIPNAGSFSTGFFLALRFA